MNLSIYKMDPSDLDEVLSIENSVSLIPWSKNLFIEEMQSSFSLCFVIKDDNRPERPVMGFICFRNIAEESELLNIGVHSEYQKTGIGKKLMEFYIDFSDRSGIKIFYLEVNSSNRPALHLYHLFSYRPTGVRHKFYQGKYDAFRMERTL